MTPARAGFDWRGFARAVSAALHVADKSLRKLAPAIGVSVTDLSRAQGGTRVSVDKVIALCDWMGADIRDFYIAPEPQDAAKSNRFTGTHVKHSSASRAAGAPAGRRDSADARSGLRASPDGGA